MSRKLPKSERVVSTPLGLTAWQIYVLDQIARLKSAETKWRLSRSEAARLVIDAEAELQGISKDQEYEEWLQANGFSDD